jgi:hypothetical protein
MSLATLNYLTWKWKYLMNFGDSKVTEPYLSELFALFFQVAWSDLGGNSKPKVDYVFE